VAVLAMSAPALAGTYWTNALGDNNYNDSGNWDAGVPGVSEAWGFINMSSLTDIALISTGTSGANRLFVGGTGTAGTYGGHAKMQTGTYTWSVSGSLYVGEKNNNGDATFVQEGGTLSLNDDLNIGYGDTTSYGKSTFKGGSLTTIDDIKVGGYGIGIFEVIGGGGSISVGDDFHLFDNGLGAAANPELRATINGTGITMIAVGDNANLNGDLIVTGGGAAPGTYTLMTYASHSGSFGAVTLPSGWTHNVGATEVTVTVPEPATMCLLGIGGIGVLIRRKRHV
jgi:hypothetical protein